MSEAPLPIREAGPADLAKIQALLERRDGIPLKARDVAHTFHGLDPARSRAWVAWDGERAVGLSAFDLVDVRGEDGPKRVAYWTNLFVEPEARGRMLYPRLPLAMVNAARAAKLPALLAAVRRPDVAAAHQALGFDAFGRRVVRAKALRPLTFLARRSRVPGVVRAAAGVLDLPWTAGLRLARGGASGRVGAPGDLAPFLAKDLPGRFWTADTLADRLEPHLDGTPYEVLAADGAAIAWRPATREDGLRIGVLMALAGDDPAALAKLLGAFEANADRAGCALLVALPPGGGGDAALRAAGYLPTPETYVLLESRAVAKGGVRFASAGDRYRFEFLDHDAL